MSEVRKPARAQIPCVTRGSKSIGVLVSPITHLIVDRAPKCEETWRFIRIPFIFFITWHSNTELTLCVPRTHRCYIYELHRTRVTFSINSFSGEIHEDMFERRQSLFERKYDRSWLVFMKERNRFYSFDVTNLAVLFSEKNPEKTLRSYLDLK